jgi:hypothetical protein
VTPSDSYVSYGPETGDLLIKINLLKLNENGGIPPAFNWVARMFGIDDYYPNTPDYNRYEVNTLNPTTLDFNVAAGNFINAASWTPTPPPPSSTRQPSPAVAPATVNSTGAPRGPPQPRNRRGQRHHQRHRRASC